MPKKRWTIEELAKTDDLAFLEQLCIDRQKDCTNINSPLNIRLGATRARLHIKQDEQRIKDRKAEEDTNLHIEILQHDISYYLDDGTAIELGDCESEHIESCIVQGYCEGELCRSYVGNDDRRQSDDFEDEVRGYWSIKKG
jgi:hypothetical protein